MVRAGFTIAGSPSALSVPRTMRNSMARRISLRRPKQSEVEALEREIEELEAAGDCDGAARLKLELEALLRRTKLIPYIDPIDVRYNRFDRIPRPNTQAVMFCLMDVSGSMTETMKDLAKRFFMLLHVFLERRYKTVDVVFIRHTSTAEEVDEETFFYSRETGGTVVSSALEKMLQIARERYPLEAWNVYAAQASDGDNYGADSGHCVELLGGEVLPLCQYFAYIEVGEGLEGIITRESDLWRSYSQVAPAHAHFAMKRVGDPTQIFSVFHELFAKEGARG
jgi:uncharacterized sporulation protein YeaH/YhbH (DUF444 family)